MVIQDKHVIWSALCLALMLMNLIVPQAMAEESSTTVSQSLKGGVNAPEEVTPDSADENEQEDFQMDQGQNVFTLLLKLFFYLVVIIVLIYGLVKFLAIRQKKIGHHHVFQTLGGTPLGPNRSLQLVKVGGKIYLLGVADHISLIKEISDVKEISIIEQDIEEQESIITKGLVDLWQSKIKPNKREGTANSFQSLFRQSLQNQQRKRQQINQDLNIYEKKREEG